MDNMPDAPYLQTFEDNPTLSRLSYDTNDHLAHVEGVPHDVLIDKHTPLSRHLGYTVASEQLSDFFNRPGIDQVRSLCVSSNVAPSSRLDFSELLSSNLGLLTGLTSLIVDEPATINVSELLEQLPNLRVLDLHTRDGSLLEPVRHANLKQLALSSSSVAKGLAVCSFPKLRYLDIGDAGQHKVIAEGILEGQFSQLAHLSLEANDKLPNLLQALPRNSIDSLGLDLVTGSDVNDRALSALIKSDLAQTLRVLDLTNPDMKSISTINHDNFPQLTKLGLHTHRFDRGMTVPKLLEDLHFENGIELDIQNANMDQRQMTQALRAIDNLNITQVNANYNRTLAWPRDLDIPVSRDYQGAREEWYD